MNDLDAWNVALLIIRVTLGVMIFAHGWRHLKAVQSGPGIADWFESLGLKPGPIHAQIVTISELAIGVGLVVGLLTPAAYGGLCSLMLVAWITNHRTHGWFIGNPGQGWEYVATVAGVALGMSALSPGEWSLDDAFGFSFPFDRGTGLLIGFLIGIVGTAAFLAVFWRPPAKAETPES